MGTYMVFISYWLASQGLSADLLTGPGDPQVVHNYRNVIAPILSRHGTGKRMRTVFPDFDLSPVELYGLAPA
jgi:hypothetical protein